MGQNDDDHSNDVSKAFDAAREMKASSEWERQKILDSLDTPQVKKDLTPGGETERVVHQEHSDAQRARLKEIEERLARAREDKSMKRNFEKKRDR